jgi:RNA polymerase sigma-70 factor (ECF subfamily)
LKNTITILRRPTELTESELIKRCVRNNRKAQKMLYQKYCNAMYGTAYRIVNDREEANDVLQDAFIQIFRDLKNFRSESTLGTWMKTIVVRAALKRLRNRLEFHTVDDPSIYLLPDHFIHLDAEYLEKAILSLPSGYRTVFLLIEVEGYSHKEVARMLDISEGTSKSQLSRAKKMLREIITGNSEE